MNSKQLIKNYFKEFLDNELSINDYYYSIMEYSKFDNGYFEIGIKNIEDLIYDSDGELLEDSKEYDLVIERFIDYLQKQKNIDCNVEDIFYSLIEKITIYCY